MNGDSAAGDWKLKRVEKFFRDQNDQKERKKENENRWRKERLVRASLLSCFFCKLVSYSTVIDIEVTADAGRLNISCQFTNNAHMLFQNMM